jgi:hypothetical protein
MKTKKIIGKIPKASHKINTIAIMESAKEVIITDGAQQKKALLGIQETNDLWIDSKCVVLFNGAIEIDKKTYLCSGWTKEEKTKLIILGYEEPKKEIKKMKTLQIFGDDLHLRINTARISPVNDPTYSFAIEIELEEERSKLIIHTRDILQQKGLDKYISTFTATLCIKDELFPHLCTGIYSKNSKQEETWITIIE